MYDYVEKDLSRRLLYLNTFTDSLGAEAHTGTSDGGYSVYHQTSDNDGRSGTAYFPYSGTNESTTNYASTGFNPFFEHYTGDGCTISFWQRINGNYWENRESITFAQREIGAKMYFTIGTDGYIRFNKGDGGNDPMYSNSQLYFDYVTPCSAVVKQQWQYITVTITDDFHIKYYVNGALQSDITVNGTDNYNLNGGLGEFIYSTDTTLYFGSYTPYWGTATLSLDNVSCYDKALTESEINALYISEAGGNIYENDLITPPERISGSITHLERYEGRDGVLYIPTCSADGDIRVYVDGVQTSDLSYVPAGSEIRLEYAGSSSVQQWRVITSDGTQYSENSTYTFTLSENTRVDVLLEVNVEIDTSALEAAIALANQYESENYSSESFAALKAAVNAGNTALASNSQLTVDNATQSILTAIYDLVPYLEFNLESVQGGTASASYDGLITAQTSCRFTPLFGTEIRLNAIAAKSYQFAGWYETKAHRILSTDMQYSFIISSNTDIRPLFDYYGSSVLTFSYGDGYIIKRIAKTPEEWGSISSIDKLCPAVPYHYGGRNGRWTYTNSEVLALLAAGESVNLTPTYNEYTPSVPQLPEITDGVPAINLIMNLDSSANVASYVMALSLPDGCEPVEKGIAFKKGAHDSFNPADFNLTLDNKTLTSKFDVTSESGIYIVNVKKFTSYAWAARAYVTYYDSEGILRAVYSDQINYE
jgi:hypothetical protein